MKINKKLIFGLLAGIFAVFLSIHYWDNIAGFIGGIMGAVMPVIIGLIIAYILNILMSFYEKFYFTKHSNNKIVKKTRRPVCLLSAIITLIVIVALIIWLVIPELISCIKIIINDIPPVLEKLFENENLTKFLPDDTLESLLDVDWQREFAKITRAISSHVMNAATTLFTAISSFISEIVVLCISLIFSVYLLLDKEKLQKYAKIIMKTFMSEKIYNKTFHVIEVFNSSFHKYIVGQCSEAIILGVLCIIGMAILRLPYAVMIGTLVGFTALIPIVGAYIGTIVGAVMIFTVEPFKAIVFIIFIIVLQQLEGNLIYPKVVGKSIGIPALLVLTAITIGGRLAGIKGMLIAVPIAAAIYKLSEEYIKKKRIEKQQNKKT